MESKSEESQIDIFGKPFGAKVHYWALHDLFGSIAGPEEYGKFKAEFPEGSPVFFTGQIERDYLRRWYTGSGMRSSLIVSIAHDVEAECLRVETLNTLYTLHGPGRLCVDAPTDYNVEVDKTSALIDGNQAEHDVAGVGQLVFLDKPITLGPLFEVIEKMGLLDSSRQN